MPAVRRTKMMERFWKAHIRLYRITGGRIGGRLGGWQVLLLFTTGRKSGERRTNALNYLEVGDDYVVVASNAGEPRPPAWWLNLQSRPTAEAQVKRRTIAVTARAAKGDEREQLWAMVVEKDRSYDEYRERTTREIPVVVLEPTG